MSNEIVKEKMFEKSEIEQTIQNKDGETVTSFTDPDKQAEVGFTNEKVPEEKVGFLNPDFGSIMISQLLSDKQCDLLVKSLDDTLWQEGKIQGGFASDNTIKTEKIRSVKQQGLPMNVEGWPHKLIDNFAKQVNTQKTKFNILGFFNNDLPVVAKYEPGDYYDWHIDCGRDSSNRKLSFTINLTDPKDYDGGDIEFLGVTTNKEAIRKKGAITIFPSFLTHRVTKIERGKRLAIVGWIHGDTFK